MEDSLPNGNKALLEEVFSNTPPEIIQSNLPQDLDLISSYEIILSSIILGFGLITFGVISYLLKNEVLDKAKGSTIIIVVFIVTSALFILAAGFSNEQMTPIIGLLGTIIGYILGNQNGKIKE